MGSKRNARTNKNIKKLKEIHMSMTITSKMGMSAAILGINALKMGVNSAKMGKLASSVAISAIAMKAISAIPVANAGGKTYTKCFTACMDGCGNAAPVCLPICSTACLPSLLF
jgi:hypothetical protein